MTSGPASSLTPLPCCLAPSTVREREQDFSLQLSVLQSPIMAVVLFDRQGSVRFFSSLVLGGMMEVDDLVGGWGRVLRVFL